MLRAEPQKMTVLTAKLLPTPWLYVEGGHVTSDRAYALSEEEYAQLAPHRNALATVYHHNEFDADVLRPDLVGPAVVSQAIALLRTMLDRAPVTFTLTTMRRLHGDVARQGRVILLRY